VTPGVTIGMSVRDGAATLRACIASVRAQTHTDWELLIRDDGSRDASAAIVAEAAAADPRIRAIGDTSRRGTATSLNELIAAARGPLFARMDADDVCFPARLERQVGHLRTHPEVEVVGCSVVVFGSGGHPIGIRRAPVGHEAITRRPLSGFRLFHPTWLGRLEWFERWGYTPDARRWEDHDLLYRAYRDSVFDNLPEPLLGYREEQLALRVILSDRLQAGRGTMGHLVREGRPGGALAALGIQLAKGALDVVALGSGLGYRLLPQRAGPISPAAATEWQAVWSAVTATPASAR
jgi:glycosyltransferase involved in cell wall biosynthesis